MSGFPDVIPLNESSLDVLFGAYKALMEQVDKDATPELLNDLKNAMIYGEDIPMESKFEELSKCLNVPSLNPLGLPFSYMFNGVIPDLSNNEQTDIEMESIEEGITSNKIPCQPECNNQITSSSIKKEKTPHTVKDTSDFKENLSFESDESDDEKTEQNTNPNKKVKICRRSKRSAKQNIY